MNKDRRKRLADIYNVLTVQKDLLEIIRDEEQEAFDNMPENFQEGEKGAQAQDIIDSLDEALSQLEEAADGISGIDGVG